MDGKPKKIVKVKIKQLFKPLNFLTFIYLAFTSFYWGLYEFMSKTKTLY